MAVSWESVQGIIVGYRCRSVDKSDPEVYYFGLPSRTGSIESARKRALHMGCDPASVERADEEYETWLRGGGAAKQVWPCFQPRGGISVGDLIAFRFQWSRWTAFGWRQIHEVVCLDCLSSGARMVSDGIIAPEEHHPNFCESESKIYADRECTEVVCDVCGKPQWGC